MSFWADECEKCTGIDRERDMFTCLVCEKFCCSKCLDSYGICKECWLPLTPAEKAQKARDFITQEGLFDDYKDDPEELATLEKEIDDFASGKRI
jgi:hypothetical protein